MAATRRKFKPYLQAKAWATRQTPKMATKADWAAMVKSGQCPSDIPTDPRSHYKDGFEGWGFLGTGVIATHRRQPCSYDEAKQWVHEQSPIIHSREEYQKRRRESGRVDIPALPAPSYRGQFEGWPTFLGVRRIASTSMIERMLKQELASFLPVNLQATTRLMVEGGKLAQVDIHIPTMEIVIEYDGRRFHQDKTREDTAKTSALQKAHRGLQVMRDSELPLQKLSDLDLLVKPGMDHLVLTQMVVHHLLSHELIKTGHKQAARAYLRRKTPAGNAIIGARWQSYENARQWARSQGLPSIAEWKRKGRTSGVLPADILAAPSIVYKQDFRGWADFLGAKIVA